MCNSAVWTALQGILTEKWPSTYGVLKRSCGRSNKVSIENLSYLIDWTRPSYESSFRREWMMFYKVR